MTDEGIAVYHCMYFSYRDLLLTIVELVSRDSLYRAPSKIIINPKPGRNKCLTRAKELLIAIRYDTVDVSN
jgi:hypothetical protein